MIRRWLRILSTPLCLTAAVAIPSLSLAIVPPTFTAPVRTSRGLYSLPVYAPEKDRQAPPVLLLSGEGGWRKFDSTLASYFRDEGFWVGGLDCLKYFWKAQDDRKALASDVRSYAAALARTAGRPADAPIILAGFSFGADLAPWVAGGEGWDRRIAGMVMLGPDEVGSLQFRVLEVFGFSEKDHIFAVSEALESARGIPALFIHGGGDAHSAAPLLLKSASEPRKLLTVPGADHHFSGREALLRATLAEGLNWLLGEAASPTPASERRP